MGKMVHGECGLEPVLSALIDIADLRGGIEHEPVDACLAQPLFDPSRKTSHAGEPRQVERPKIDPHRWCAPRAEEEPDIRYLPRLLCGGEPYTRGPARHYDRLHSVLGLLIPQRFQSDLLFPVTRYSSKHDVGTEVDLLEMHHRMLTSVMARSGHTVTHKPQARHESARGV